jgi:hypothetical protein
MEHDMLSGVDLTRVRIEDGFWSARQTVKGERTLPHNIKWCVQTGRVANFEKAAARGTAGHEGYFFNDSDVYKVIEGAAYMLATQRDAAVEALLDAWIDQIATAQCPDGYLHTFHQLGRMAERWTNDQYHELYCAGALFEAAVAYERATGKTKLMGVARKTAEHVAAVFGPGKKLMAPEHPEIELALVKFWRHTGEQRWLELARFFVEQRGRHETRPSWKEYAQDHRPIREQAEIVGHAVRALYLYSAVTDLAGECEAELRAAGDAGYVQALERLWNDLLTRKLYVTGGTGVWGCDEGFAGAYELPNERSYAETCASIGLAFWSHRLALLHGDARYMDVFERVAYNAVLAGVALDGEKFLYANPLASRGVAGFQTAGTAQGGSRSHRQHWFRCACCPPSVLRFVAAIAGYIYAHADDAVYVNLYVAGEADVPLPGGRVRLTQKTRYPWEGGVELTVTPQRQSGSARLNFALLLRIPAWCDGARIDVNGAAVASEPVRGYARIRREWRAGDVVTLTLPMPVQRIECIPRVQSNAGRVALQRGPIVYCVEAADHPDGVWNLALPPEADIAAEHRPNLLGGVTVLKATGLRRGAEDWAGRLYRPAPGRAPATEKAALLAVPYCVWDNRTPGAMLVWLPQSPVLAEPTP